MTTQVIREKYVRSIIVCNNITVIRLKYYVRRNPARVYYCSEVFRHNLIAYLSTPQNTSDYKYFNFTVEATIIFV